MWNIIGYIFLVALFMWFFSVLEKIKDILSDIKYKISSLDLKSDNVDSFKIDSIDNTAERISRQLGEVEDKLRDIEEKISDESGARRISILLESIESKLEDIKEAIIRRGGRDAGGKVI